MRVNKVLRSISIYPSADWKTCKHMWEEYLNMVNNYGFKEVFSSMHLPELSLYEQIEGLAALASLVKEKDMELTVDIGGSAINEILEQYELRTKVKNMKIDFLRMDYGYEKIQVKEIYNKLNVSKFVINASILREEEVIENVEFLRSLNNDIEIRACHNFYPRKETGITHKFLRSQYSYFHVYDIPVYACIASMTKPRGPLHEGLPTIEEHRYMSVDEATAALLDGNVCDGILIGDEFLKEEEIRKIDSVVKQEPFRVRVRLGEEITCEERDILLSNVHHIRYDSNDLVLRSQTSRQMAEYGKKIHKGSCKERTSMCITIDNELYGRYSGELQVVLKSLPRDSRVNVIAFIDKADKWKLQYYRKGYDFIFYVN